MKRLFVYVSLLIIPVSAFSVSPHDELTKQIVGKWVVSINPELDSEDSESLIFKKDGTVTGLVRNDDNEVFSWTAIDDDVIRIQAGNGDISYIVVEPYRLSAKHENSPLLEDEAMWNCIKDQYTMNTSYAEILFVFYVIPASKVKSDKYDRKILRSINDAIYAAEANEYADMKKMIDEANANAEKEQKEYIASLEKRWGKKTAQAIIENRIFIGMLSDQVKESIGEPSNIETIENGSGKVEVWEYIDRILYFKNGRLNTIHSTNQ